MRRIANGEKSLTICVRVSLPLKLLPVLDGYDPRAR